MGNLRIALALVSVVTIALSSAQAKSLDFPSSEWGISFGNSQRFNGLRFNYRDHDVEEINGVNVTLWKGYRPQTSVIRGVSFGVLPSGGRLVGLNLGLLGAGAEQDLHGLSLGLLGAGAGGNIHGITVGALGCGAGGNVRGLALGGLGAGAGGNVTGIVMGWLGCGAGGNVTGCSLGLLGCGAGGNVSGITLGGLGCGAGGNLKGIALGGLGAGAGGNVTGIVVGGLGCGAGGSVTGVTVAGLGCGAGGDFTGGALALGTVQTSEESRFTGLSVSAFNRHRGHQSGLALGIVNLAETLYGVQIGLVNIVQSREDWSKVLPLVNAGF